MTPIEMRAEMERLRKTNAVMLAALENVKAVFEASKATDVFKRQYDLVCLAIKKAKGQS